MPDMTERMLVKIVVVEVGVEHHAQGGRHEADGLGAVPPHHVDPTVDGESFEEGDAASVEHGLHHAEHAAHVDQRRVDDDDTFPQPDVGVGGTLVVLGPVHHQFEHLVAEIDALRRARSCRS